MSTPLLTTKLYPPFLRPDFTPRPALTQRLNDGLRQGRRLTLVSAPAGFGKSTLVNTWLKDIDRAAAWVQLDAADNTPGRFWAYVVSALQTIDPASGQSMLAAMQSPQPPQIELALTGLINELHRRRQPFILVLDDLHLVTNPNIHQALAFLLNQQPAQMHLVITTRQDPPLPLARLRVRNQLTELRAVDLRFSAAEINTFFRETINLTLTAKDLQRLTERTEGWVAGLQLAALSLERHPNQHRFIAEFAGDDQHVTDYLMTEILQQQPSNIRDFLLQTAILDHLHGPLCDAVVYPDQPPGRSHALITELAAANLFVIPLDNKRRWYRYHNLFVDLLRHRLLSQAPDMGPTLHRRAARWYDTADTPVEAVNHALAANDIDLALTLIAKHAAGMIYQSHTQTVIDWLEALPPQVLNQHPMLLVMQAWATHLTRSIEANEVVEAILQQAETITASNPPSPADQQLVAGHVASIRTSMALSVELGRNPQKIIDLARRANTTLPDEEIGIRSVNQLSIGFAHLARQELNTAREALKAAVALGQTGGNHYVAVSALHTGGQLALDEGDLQQTEAICRDGLDYYLNTLQMPAPTLPILGALYAGLGTVELYRYDLAAAKSNLETAVDLIRWTNNLGALMMSIDLLSELLAVQANHSALADVLTLTKTMSVGSDLLTGFSTYLQARLWLLQAQTNPDVYPALAQWTTQARPMLDWLPGSYGYEQLTHSIRCLWLRAKITLSNPLPNDEQALVLQELHTLLQRWQHPNPHLNFIRRLELIVLETWVLARLNRLPEALNRLAAALTMAAPHNLRYPFIRDGANLPLASITPDPATATFVAGILAEPPQSANIRPKAKRQQGLVEPLSDRELEVLALIAEGLTNPEIATRLFVSRHTIRTHSSNIYGKLGVRNRTEAVSAAKTLGLLSA